MDQSNTIISELESYLLNCLAEELAEQLQEVCKMRRFGVQNRCPVSGKTNLEKFYNETVDAEGIKWLLARIGCPMPQNARDPVGMAAKILRTADYARHSVNAGVLSEEACELLEEVSRATPN